MTISISIMSLALSMARCSVILYNSAKTLLINHPDKIEHDKIDTMIGHLVNSTGRKHYGKYNEQTILEVVKKIGYL